MKEFFEQVRELGNAPQADLIEKDFTHRTFLFPFTTYDDM